MIVIIDKIKNFNEKKNNNRYNSNFGWNYKNNRKQFFFLDEKIIFIKIIIKI